MHHDLLHALLPIIARTTYQDSRRLNTFVWAIVGLCLTHTVRLSAWAEVLESHAQYAASRERRFSRWLHHPGIVPSDWYRPVIQAALSGWSLDQRLYIALDTTALTPFVLIRTSLLYRGRAISLAWRVFRHRSTQVSLASLPACAGPGACHDADRPGNHAACRSWRMSHERLLHYLHQHQWHFRLRLPGDTLVQLPGQPISAVKDLCPSAGESRFIEHVALLGTAVGAVHLALACLLDQPDDRLYRGA